jgi:predicted aminopeptidase
MVTDRRSAQALLRPVLLAGLGLLLSGCGVSYVAQAARGQFDLMRAREPVARVLARPDTPATLRTTLEQSRRIRDFASAELGLPDNASYRSYADLRRPYAVWNVVAAPVLSLTPRNWCFPVAGCVAYRGYFNERAAEAFAARLRARGDDVIVGGVPAYSTLGHFADPLTSTMTRYGELEIAALVFHELAHQVAYLPGDSAYNEAFATVVEEEGVARYAAARGVGPALADWRRRRAQRVEIARLFLARRAQLLRIYAGSTDEAGKRQGKARVLEALAGDLRDLERRSGQPTGYGPWIDAGLNNAHLVSIATYYDQMPRFERMLAAQGADLPRFYASVREEVALRRPKPPGPQVGPHPVAVRQPPP